MSDTPSLIQQGLHADQSEGEGNLKAHKGYLFGLSADQAAAMMQNGTQELLTTLAHHPVPTVRMVLAAHPTTPTEALEVLLKDSHPTVQLVLASRSEEWVIRQLISQAPNVLASNPATPDEVLCQLTIHPHLHKVIALHPKADLALSQIDLDQGTATALAINKNTPLHLLQWANKTIASQHPTYFLWLLKDEDPRIRRLARRQGFPKLSTHPDPYLRAAGVSKATQLKQEWLSDHLEVRRGLSENPNTPKSWTKELLCDDPIINENLGIAQTAQSLATSHEGG